MYIKYVHHMCANHSVYGDSRLPRLIAAVELLCAGGHAAHTRCVVYDGTQSSLLVSEDPSRSRASMVRQSGNLMNVNTIGIPSIFCVGLVVMQSDRTQPKEEINMDGLLNNVASRVKKKLRRHLSG